MLNMLSLSFGIILGYSLIAILILISMVLVSNREKSIDIQNPSPKFSNGDKRIGEIELVDANCIKFETGNDVK